MWNEFLPISMPMTATAELSSWDMAWLLVWAPLTSLSPVGQEHGRTIPLAAIRCDAEKRPVSRVKRKSTSPARNDVIDPLRTIEAAQMLRDTPCSKLIF